MAVMNEDGCLITGDSVVNTYHVLLLSPFKISDIFHISQRISYELLEQIPVHAVQFSS